ncbi:hypothetical protein [Granulicella arctica]|uniref:hypothetical protein n=1 Tax=Granulicella arctica TaxID=940613 RepID=UPI0021E0E788|nr:hypothetical protein [Granulicella arctica]
MRAVIAYGRCIESDLPFDALPSAEHTAGAIRIEVQRDPEIPRDPGVSVRPCNAQGRMVHIVSHDLYVTVQVDHILSFELWLTANRIQCSALTDVSDALLSYWLLQQIIPLFLLLCGSTEFLHGMAVSSLPIADCGTDESSCVGFLGASHAGKSTLLSYFLNKGHSLVTDDHVALAREDYTRVLPAVPFYRAYRAPEDLGVAASHYSAKSTRLKCLYLLSPAPPEAAPRMERLVGAEAIRALFPNILYSLHNAEKPDFFPLVEDRFRGLADIVRRVPFAILHVPRSLERLHEVYNFIQNDLGGQRA